MDLGEVFQVSAFFICLLKVGGVEGLYSKLYKCLRQKNQHILLSGRGWKLLNGRRIRLTHFILVGRLADMSLVRIYENIQ